MTFMKERSHTLLTYVEIPFEAVSVQAIQETSGKPYDIWSNLLHLFGAKKFLKYRAKKRLNCAERVAMILEVKDPHLQTPQSLYELLREK